MATFMNTHHVWSMIIDIAMNIDRLDQWSKVKLYEHRSSMIINHKWHSSRSMIVAMKCRWSYMISVDQWVISWTLGATLLLLRYKSSDRMSIFYKQTGGYWVYFVAAKEDYDCQLLHLRGNSSVMCRSYSQHLLWPAEWKHVTHPPSRAVYKCGSTSRTIHKVYLGVKWRFWQ